VTNEEKLIRDIETLRQSIQVNREHARGGTARAADLLPHTAWCMKELEILQNQLEGLHKPLIGCYRCEHSRVAHNHRVRVVADGERWRILFDPITTLPDLDTGAVSLSWEDRTTYREARSGPGSSLQ